RAIRPCPGRLGGVPAPGRYERMPTTRLRAHGKLRRTSVAAAGSLKVNRSFPDRPSASRSSISRRTSSNGSTAATPIRSSPAATPAWTARARRSIPQAYADAKADPNGSTGLGHESQRWAQPLGSQVVESRELGVVDLHGRHSEDHRHDAVVAGVGV